MSKSRYGDMQAFAKKLQDMGYSEVKLIDTTDGTFRTQNSERSKLSDTEGLPLLIRKDLLEV